MTLAQSTQFNRLAAMAPAASPLCSAPPPSRLLKKAHLRRPTCGGYPRAPATLRRTRKYASRLGSRTALHLDLFEQPGRKQVFQHLARTEWCTWCGPTSSPVRFFGASPIYRAIPAATSRETSDQRDSQPHNSTRRKPPEATGRPNGYDLACLPCKEGVLGGAGRASCRC
jgi:hypothetical protein